MHQNRFRLLWRSSLFVIIFYLVPEWEQWLGIWPSIPWAWSNPELKRGTLKHIEMHFYRWEAAVFQLPSTQDFCGQFLNSWVFRHATRKAAVWPQILWPFSFDFITAHAIEMVDFILCSFVCHENVFFYYFWLPLSLHVLIASSATGIHSGCALSDLRANSSAMAGWKLRSFSNPVSLKMHSETHCQRTD